MEKLENSVKYQASLLDSDSQLVSKGEALFHTDISQGAFWPRDEASEDSILKNATIVQTSSGHRRLVQDLRRCGSSASLHYDFDYKPLTQKPE